LKDSERVFAIGMDIGGTHLRAGLYAFSHDSGVLKTTPLPLAAVREKVGQSRTPDEITSRIALLLPRLVKEAGLPRSTDFTLGVAFAGMFAGQDAHVANAPHFGWKDIPFGSLLRQRLGGKQGLTLLNDVNAATYAEYTLQAEHEEQDLLAFYVGTGIGAGAICSGKLLWGATNTATELGHIKVAVGEDAPLCACGHRGCLEAYAGGKAIQKRVRSDLQTRESLIIKLAGGIGSIHPGHIEKAAAESDEYALSLYSELSPILGLALANAVTLLNPAKLILGGGVLENSPILKRQLLAKFRDFVNPPALLGLTIADTSFGDEAGMLGAALLAENSH